MILLGILIGLLILTFVVAIHELGHGLVARKSGVRVKEFGIGFPPLAFGKKIKKSILGKDVLYSVNWLPIGGFVRLQGEHDSDSGKGDYGAATLKQKSAILLAGVAMNWLTAIVVFSILALFGMPKFFEGQFSIASDTVVQQNPITITKTSPDSPAEKAGIMAGDIITRINGTDINDIGDISQALSSVAEGTTVAVVLERDGILKQIEASPATVDGKQRLGIGLSQVPSTYRATWSAPIVGVGLTTQMTVLTVQGVGDTVAALVKGVIGKISLDANMRDAADKNLETAGGNVAGPVGLVGQIVPTMLQGGPTYIAFLIGAISIALAVMNVLPIPALDGGRLYTTIWYRKVLKKPLTAEKEEKINATGFLVLMGLFVLITFSDITKLLG